MVQQNARAFDMPLAEVIEEKQILDNLDTSTARQTIDALVDQLVGLKLLDSKSTAVRRVMERERLAPTALGSGIAIPHARMEVGEKPLFAVGRHIDGVDFEAPDGKPVHLVFLLIWQPERPGLFNQLFANLVAKLNNPSFRNELMESKDRSEMLAKLGAIHLNWMQSVETALDGQMLLSLQELEAHLGQGGDEDRKLEHKIELVRQDLDPSILWRYDRLKKLHGIAVVSGQGGVCGGCSMQLSSGLASEILKKPRMLFICERCGRFLMHDKGDTDPS